MNIKPNRIRKEVFNLIRNPIKNVEIVEDEIKDNSLHFYITGLKGTIYEYLTYKIRFYFADDYPFSAFNIQFLTPMYHPNVDKDGYLYILELQSGWSPSITIESVFEKIFNILDTPTQYYIKNTAANYLLGINKNKYIQKVRRVYIG